MEDHVSDVMYLNLMLWNLQNNLQNLKWKLKSEKFEKNFTTAILGTHQVSLGGAPSFHGMHMTQMLC